MLKGYAEWRENVANEWELGINDWKTKWTNDKIIDNKLRGTNENVSRPYRKTSKNNVYGSIDEICSKRN